MRSLRHVTTFALVVGAAVAGLVPGSMPAARADHDPVHTDLVVDTFADTFDGSCGDGSCSLRDAVASVPDGGSIGLPAGFFGLTRTGDDPIGEGAIELDRSMTIRGLGLTASFLDGSGLEDRLFEVRRGARVRLIDLTLLGGDVGSEAGGAIRVRRGALAVDEVTLTDNRATDGGAIAVAGPGGRLSVRRSILLDNVATAQGGAISVGAGGTLRLRRSALAGNVARQLGGAVMSSASTSVTITDTTLARNRAGDRGGALHLSGTALIDRATVARNRADRHAGVSAQPGSDVTFAGSIVADNIGVSASPQCSRRVGSRGFNIEGGGDSCRFDARGDLVRADARLRTFGPYGGPTPTIALRADSPAIDRGGVCGRWDQRGAPRRNRCDAGGYELVRCLGRPVDIVGTPGDDELSGGRGPDTFLGLAGNDEFQGSLGHDRACGNGGADLLLGGPGRDRLHAGAGDDRLEGEAGNDVLIGGPGADLLIGGPGHDVCIVDRHDRWRGCEVVRQRR